MNHFINNFLNDFSKLHKYALTRLQELKVLEIKMLKKGYWTVVSVDVTELPPVNKRNTN